jgi:glycosyltransferase involved in cell wall biosynthesis
MKSIAIYDRYLSTAGGGERYSCKIAEVLSKNKEYRVDLITDIFADLKEVSRRLNLDLNKVNLKIFPFISEDYAVKITKKYNLFINATYLSSLPAHSSGNLYLCYFPTPFDVDFKFIHRFLLFFFRKPAIWLFKAAGRLIGGFDKIEVEEGIYEPKRFLLRRGSWSSGKIKLKVMKSERYMELGLKNPEASALDLMKVNIKVLEGKARDDRPIYDKDISLVKGAREIVRVPLDTRNEFTIIKVLSSTFKPSEEYGDSEDSRSLGVVMYDERKINLLKKFILKVLGYIPLFLITFPDNLRFLETYHKIITISEYSKKWIKKLWKRDSVILYPPVDTDSFRIEKKEKIILSVGRFFPEHHNKKQLEMVEIFKQLLEKYPGQMKGYTLYLAGGVSKRPDHLKYVEKVIAAAGGYPVKVITNIEWKELVKIFARSFIFWHASGMGEDEEAHPEKFEHFGITTVEAMAAGCIPVVINKGGQKEIIEHGYNGFLFSSRQELKDITLDIIKGKVEVKRIINNAILSCRRFSDIKFEENLISIINKIMEEHPAGN